MAFFFQFIELWHNLDLVWSVYNTGYNLYYNFSTLMFFSTELYNGKFGRIFVKKHAKCS